jgi:hypothetical protein
MFNRPKHAWGSVISQFYGAHSVSCFEDASLILIYYLHGSLYSQMGGTLFGILLEYLTPSRRKLKE